MFRVLEFVLFAALLLITVTEILYPLIAGKPMFGSFRSSGKPSPKSNDLEDLVAKAKEKVNEVKDIQKEVDSNFKSAERLKDESDNLLNKD